jgi:hypothetical protein
MFLSCEDAQANAREGRVYSPSRSPNQLETDSSEPEFAMHWRHSPMSIFALGIGALHSTTGSRVTSWRPLEHWCAPHPSRGRPLLANADMLAIVIEFQQVGGLGSGPVRCGARGRTPSDRTQFFKPRGEVCHRQRLMRRQSGLRASTYGRLAVSRHAS